MAKTIGQEEDDAAFAEIWRAFWKAEGKAIPYGHESFIQVGMEQAWAAGMKRGLSKRGCCEAEEPERD